MRVLHIMGCSDVGGISTVVLNYYRFMDRSRIQFDIALTVPGVGRNALALQELGAKIHFLPLKSEGIGAFQKALAELLKQCPNAERISLECSWGPDFNAAIRSAREIMEIFR